MVLFNPQKAHAAEPVYTYQMPGKWYVNASNNNQIIHKIKFTMTGNTTVFDDEYIYIKTESGSFTMPNKGFGDIKSATRYILQGVPDYNLFVGPDALNEIVDPNAKAGEKNSGYKAVYALDMAGGGSASDKGRLTWRVGTKETYYKSIEPQSDARAMQYLSKVSAALANDIAYWNLEPFDPGSSDAYSITNIDAYIADKILKYPIATNITQEDQNIFRDFVNAFKNTEAGYARDTLKHIVDVPAYDPDFFGIKETSGDTEIISFLKASEVQALRQKYFDDYDGSQAKFDALMLEINKSVENLWNDKIKNSCGNLATRLSVSQAWIGVYKLIGATLGAGAGTYLFKNQAGLIGGAALGAGTGQIIEKYVRDGQIDEADRLLAEYAHDIVVLIYKLNYVLYKDTMIGLEEFSSSGGNIAKERGINPQKMRQIESRIKSLKSNFDECFKTIQDLLQPFRDFVEGSTCGFKLDGVTGYIGAALCGILQLIADAAKWIISLFDSVYNAYHPPDVNHGIAFLTQGFTVQQARAQVDPAQTNVSPLIESLTSGSTQWPWVIPTWKFVLTLTNLFLVVILLFLGIVNMMHIQYDTYQLKKTLPILIIGIILANFSLVIMRMLLTFANVLTKSFMDGSPGQAVKDLILAFNLQNLPTQGTGFIQAMNSLGAILLAIIFAVFALIAFLILGFMFYMRYVSIIVLAIAAPAAFVLMAFGPTQGVFKQWWEWTWKMVFMKPIAMFLIMVAIQVKGTDGTINSITGWIIITALVYLAILVPWKLGGFVAQAWGGVGKWASTPVRNWAGRRAKSANTFVKGLPGIRHALQSGKADDLEVAAKEKALESKIEKGARARKGGRATAWEEIAAQEENELKTLINDQKVKLYEGELNLDLLTRIRMGGVKWAGGPSAPSTTDLASRMVDAEVALGLSDKNLTALKTDALMTRYMKAGQDNDLLKQRVDDLQKQGIYMDNIDIDEHGRVQFTTANDEKSATVIDYENKATELDEEALITENDQKRAELKKSARTLRERANVFKKNNPITEDGKNLYAAYMDKRYSGRVYSLATAYLMDEVNTNMLNETSESMFKRALEGGGSRNKRFNRQNLLDMIKMNRKGIDTRQREAAAWELKTWTELLGRKGLRDRGLVFTNFLRAFDNGEAFEEGAVMNQLTQTQELRRQGSTASFVREQVIDANKRNATLTGFEDLEGVRGDTTQEFLTNAATKWGITQEEASAEILRRVNITPEIFSQAQFTTGTNSFRDSRAYLDDLAEIVGQVDNFCAPGNITGHVVSMKDTPADPFASFQKLRDRATQTGGTGGPSGPTQPTTPSPDQILRDFAAASPEQLSGAQDPIAAARGYSKALNELSSRMVELSQFFKIDGNAPDFQTLQSLIESMADTKATTMAGFMTEAQAKLGKSISLTVQTNPAEIEMSEWTNNATMIRSGMNNAAVLDEQIKDNQAQDIQGHIPKREMTDDQVDASIAKLEATVSLLNENIGKIIASQDPDQSISAEVIKQALGNINQVNPAYNTPLFQEALQKNNQSLSQLVQKTLIGLNAVKESRQAGNIDVLTAIKNKLNKLTMLPGSTTTPPPAPAPAAQAATEPPAPAPSTTNSDGQESSGIDSIN